MSTLIRLSPSLTLAAGILGGTAVAKWTHDARTGAIAGVALLVAATLGAVRLQRRVDPDTAPAHHRVVLGLGIVLALAGAIVIVKDPARMAATLPILGASAFAALLGGTSCRRPRLRGARS